MRCKNPHCRGLNFIAVVEENSRLIGVKCSNCGARYSVDEFDILESVNREGYWNSVHWLAELIKEKKK